MELKSSQFDMTNPFARPTRQTLEIERRLMAMPAARRQEILADYLPPVTSEVAHAVEMSVQTTPFPVEEWRSAPVTPATRPTVIYRPRRVSQPSTWQWRLIVAGIRLARKQARLTLKASRRLLRRALRHHRAMRGY